MLYESAELEGFPLMTWCQLCWLGAILWSKMNQCGAAVASYVLVRGNALAQAKRGLVDDAGDKRLAARALCALLTAALVVSRKVKDGLSDGTRDVQ